MGHIFLFLCTSSVFLFDTEHYEWCRHFELFYFANEWFLLCTIKSSLGLTQTPNSVSPEVRSNWNLCSFRFSSILSGHWGLPIHCCSVICQRFEEIRHTNVWGSHLWNFFPSRISLLMVWFFSQLQIVFSDISTQKVQPASWACDLHIHTRATHMA